jgi:hypothetical protein
VFGKGSANDAWSMGLNQAVKNSMSVSTNISSAAQSAGDMASGFSSAAKSAAKLKKTIAGFDELEILNGPDDSGSGGIGDIGGGGGFDVGTYFDPEAFEMPDFSLFELQARMWLENIKEQFNGLTKALTDNTNTIKEMFD